MHSVGSTKSEVESSTDEKAWRRLDGKSHLYEIYLLLKREDTLTAEELREAQDKGKEAISSNLNEMKRRNVVTVVGEQDTGQRGRNPKVWGLVDGLREDEPMKIIEEKRVVETETIIEEKEVPRNDDIWDVLERNQDLISLTIGGSALGLGLFVYEVIWSTLGNIPEFILLVSVTGLGTVLSMAVKEVRSNGE